MVLTMMHHLHVNTNLNEAEMRKMLTSLQKDLINIEFYYNLNMNTVGDQLKLLIMYLE